MTAGRSPSLIRRHFAGTTIVVLCLATPIAIGVLMALRVQIDPVYLVLAAICAGLGLVFALSGSDDETPAEAGPPEDDF